MSTAFVVPYQAARHSKRERAWREIRQALAHDHPRWPIVLGHSDEPWSKGAADRARAVGWLDRSVDVVIVHDADCYVEPHALRAAVEAVHQGAGWAVPHLDVRRLSEQATEELYRGGGCDGALAEPAYHGMIGGGIVVLPRATYEDCPIDPRFVGWGSEDQAWGWCLTALYGEPWRGQADLIHLWHPPPVSRYQRRSVLPTSVGLWRAYRSARHEADLTRLRALVADARLHAFAPAA